jgi:hypothetical protein
MPLVNGSDVSTSLLPLMSAAYVRSLIPGLALASKCKMTLEPSTLYVPVYATRALNKAARSTSALFGWPATPSFACLGRRAVRSACHCVARYSRPPLRVAAPRARHGAACGGRLLPPEQVLTSDLYILVHQDLAGMPRVRAVVCVASRGDVCSSPIPALDLRQAHRRAPNRLAL